MNTNFQDANGVEIKLGAQVAWGFNLASTGEVIETGTWYVDQDDRWVLVERVIVRPNPGVSFAQVLTKAPNDLQVQA